MSEEINKIIDNLEGCIGMFDYLLTPIESNLLVSYIKELQQENKKLNGTIQTYDILLKANVEENKILKDNWNKLKKLLNQKYYNGERIDIKDILDEMQELEQGSD